jgi:NAD(P)-dependent dehydrogenase (short-subunit alcohol dehydrogenase family)
MKLSTAVITGISTGIGYETARTLAGRGFHVFGSVRRGPTQIGSKPNLGINLLLFNLTLEMHRPSGLRPIWFAQAFADSV